MDMYQATKTFTNSCGDVIKYHALLRKIANHGDYTEFVVDEPINGFVYLNDKEINMYLQETHLESDLMEWLHR